MDRNSYKTQKQKGLFAYLAPAKLFKADALSNLSGRYIFRLLFIFFIGIIYVGNTHYYEKTVRKIALLEQEVDVLRVDYTTRQSDYMFDSKQSEVAKRVAPMGLYEVPHPPSKISSK
ncbi:MAG: FtsL-like putative cell division protein [Bacteroidota bacterium]